MTAHHRLVQLSDIHIIPSGELRANARPIENLRRCLAEIERFEFPPEAMLFTGDLVDRGDEHSYNILRELVEPVSDRLRATTVYLPGNHDDRRTMRAALFGLEASEEPINQVVWVGDLRVVALDSTVPHAEFGELDASQLEWLREVLRSPAPCGTLLALHHPPIPSPITSMSKIALVEPGALAELLHDSDVHLVICGHNHHASVGSIGGVPVFVAPSTAYRSDPLSESEFRGLPGAFFSRIDVIDGAPTVTVVPVPLPGSVSS